LGYEFGSDERLRVYLTNTLEPPHESEQKALDFPDFLAHEAQAADEVKGKTPISVVFGNPPYSSSVTENSWIMGLIADFKKDLGEQKADLSREEWKFMRLAGYYAQRTPNLITGWVINNAFLKAITHRLLRQHLYETASKIRVVNLHGSSKPPEFVPAEIQSGLGISKKDVNVFDIQQGVTIFLSLARKEEIIPEVTYFDLWGTRERKYEQLSKDLLKSPSVKPLDPTLPQFFFIPRDNSNEEEYAQGVSIEAIFTSNVSGIQSGRDHFVSTMNEAELSNRIKAIADGQSWASIAPDVAPPIWSGFSLSSFRHALKANERCRASWLSCPFDVRPILFHSSVIKRTRGDIMANMLRPNIGLSSVRQLSTPSWRHVFAVNGIISDTGISQNSREYNYLFPLYLYPSKTQTAMDLDAQLLGFGPDKRRANLSPDFVAQMGTKLSLKWQSDGRGDLKTHFGPEDVLAYIYAVFHAPSYRARYAEFLKTDFPRVPLTSDVSLFRSLVEFGHELLAIHTLSEEVTAKAPTAGPTPSGEVAAGYPKFCSGRVSINTKSSFDDVPEAVWNFHIGGYQVAHKWLKDRKGRELTPDDAKHYRRVLWALGETITRMEAIDELIEGAGGFPLVGSGEKVEVDVNRFFD
jgi:predicted helicase